MEKVKSLKQTIQDDIKKAMISKDAERLSVLRMILAAISNKEKDKRGKLAKQGKETDDLEKLSVLTDEETIEVIFSENKKRRDSIEQYAQAGRQDLVDSEKKELEILQTYLPEQMSEDEIRKLVQEKIKELGVSEPKDIGKLMQVLMPIIKGKADGKLIGKIVQEELKN